MFIVAKLRDETCHRSIQWLVAATGLCDRGVIIFRKSERIREINRSFRRFDDTVGYAHPAQKAHWLTFDEFPPLERKTPALFERKNAASQANYCPPTCAVRTPDCGLETRS